MFAIRKTPRVAPVLSFMIFINGGPALADPVEPGEGPIIVEAEEEGPERAYGRTGATTRVDLTSRGGRYRGMGDLLEGETSVRINRYGGRGAYNTLSLRGSNPNQTNLYIDGIPITGAATGEVNLADWNPAGFGSLEIYRSGDYGAATVGGSVNLVTKKGDVDCSHTRIKALGGYYRTAGLGVDSCGSPGEETSNLYYNIQTRAEVSRQDYSFYNDNGTPVLNSLDDYIDKRQNAGYREIFNTLNLGAELGDTTLGLLVDSAYRNHGLPGPASGQTEKTERFLRRHTIGLTSDTKGLIFDEFRLGAKLYYSDSRTEFFDPRQEFSFNQPNSRTAGQTSGAILEPTIYLLDWYQTLRIYTALARETYRQDRRDKVNRYLETLPVRFRNQGIFRLTDEISFWDERIIFTPSGEYRRIRDRFNEEKKYTTLKEFLDSANQNPVREFGNYRMSARVVFYQADSFQVYMLGGWSTGKRAPLFIELFGDRGAIIGNPNLLPESSETLEGGLGLKMENGTLDGQTELTIFKRAIKDMILFIPNSQFTLRPENLDAAMIQGAEWNNRFELFESLRLKINYTYTRAINRSEVSYLNGNYLPLRPLHELQSGLTYFNPEWEVGAEAVFVGATFRDRTNEAANYVPSRWVYNFFISYQFGETLPEQTKGRRGHKRWNVNLDIKNILDTRVSDVNGYPLPGRSAYASAAYTF